MTYLDKITPLLNDLIVLVKRPNLAYVEAMSTLHQAAIASEDKQVDKSDLLFLYSLAYDALKQLQATLPTMKTAKGFADTLQQLLDLHIQLLAE